MKVQSISNNTNYTSFGAGKIRLKRITQKELSKYDAIKKIAETDKLDFSISKSNESKYLPTSDCYIVVAKQELEKFPYSALGVGCAIVNKKAKTAEVSEKLYDAVLKSIDRLADRIKEHMGTKPEFLKCLNG